MTALRRRRLVVQLKGRTVRKRFRDRVSTVRNHPRTPRRMRRQHAGVEHQVDSRPRNERSELLQQRERLEHKMARPVCPGRLQREHDATVGQALEPILGHGRTKQVAAQLFEA